ncbi:hypothetical protein P9D80_08580 [Bacillus spizizenii]|uniref:DUF6414 family protein n=1 Tax=Bacillus spizizenii TaxID=96241 RepID=UPI002DBC75AB|nr:hypothetical protein [Bacillus spizizenii]MEC1585378.1 hypothetical protein [Bacillus spizizenii]
MFKNLIYFDNIKVAEYGALLEGKKHVAIRNVKVSSSKTASTKIPVISAGINGNNEIEGEIVENLLLDCNEFEELLTDKGTDNYFDFLEYDYDSETIPRTSIVRFEGGFKIPEEFDMMDLINQFKPMLSSSMNIKNAQEEELLSKVFAKESTKIPAFLDSDSFENRLGFAKLNSQNLLYELEHLEDFEDEDVTIIAKVLSRKNVKQNKPIVLFDIMKDLFSLSRGIRRQVGQDKMDGLSSIESNEDVIIFEVLAIYQ